MFAGLEVDPLDPPAGIVVRLADGAPRTADGGLSVRGVEPVQFAGSPVTSARLGDAVAAGALAAAEQMLGRPLDA